MNSYQSQRQSAASPGRKPDNLNKDNLQPSSKTPNLTGSAGFIPQASSGDVTGSVKKYTAGEILQMMKIDYSHLNNSVTPAKKNDGDVEKGMEKQAGYYSLEQNEGQQLGWFDDEQGKFIGEHWLNGSGMDVRINSEEWANYMRSSTSINNLLMKMIDHDFQTRKGSDSFWLRTKGDTGFNDRRTGLGMLHTTSNFICTLGYFTNKRNPIFL